MTRRPFRLYPRPSFLEGLARLIDVGNVLNQYNYSESDSEADYKANLSDWEAVGQDLRYALKKFEKEHRKQLQHGRRSDSPE